MSTEQIRAALKEAALKATPGPWIFQSYGKLMTVATVGHVEHYTFGPDCGEPHMIQYEDHADAEDDVRFCALANPATVLQLLTENEAMQHDIAWSVAANAELATENEALRMEVAAVSGRLTIMEHAFKETAESAQDLRESLAFANNARMHEAGDASRLVWAMDQGHMHGTEFVKWVLERGGNGDIWDCRTFIDAAIDAAKDRP